MVQEQSTAKEILRDKLYELVNEGRLPHAMLFTSKEGGGAMPLALKLAKYILCQNKENNQSCNNCNSCNSVDRLTHPDLFLSFPVFNKDSRKKYTSNDYITEFRSFITQNGYATPTAWIQSLTNENKQGNISAEECKEISSKMMLKSILGGAKILIVWYAEYLGKEGNRLLKLIEEPPKNTFIIFVAENTNKILGTILSRTQHFKLSPIPQEEIVQELLKKEIDQEQAERIAKQSEGNMHKALQLANHSGADYYNHLRNWLNALYTNNGALLAGWLKESNTLSKEELKAFFSYVNHILEQSIRVKHLPEEMWSLTDQEIRVVKGLLSKGLTAQQCEQVTEICERTIYHIERNVYKKVLLNAISFEVQETLLSQ